MAVAAENIVGGRLHFFGAYVAWCLNEAILCMSDVCKIQLLLYNSTATELKCIFYGAKYWMRGVPQEYGLRVLLPVGGELSLGFFYRQVMHGHLRSAREHVFGHGLGVHIICGAAEERSHIRRTWSDIEYSGSM